MRGRPLKTSTVWKLVREQILWGKEEFICQALYNLQDEKITRDRARDLVGQVCMSIHGYDTYTLWVKYTYPDVFRATPEKDRDAMARQGRLAWLDHLIAEAKAKGD